MSPNSFSIIMFIFNLLGDLKMYWWSIILVPSEMLNPKIKKIKTIYGLV